MKKKHTKTNSKVADINPTLSVIILSINVLNIFIKRLR
jgi:hypothetical protein